MYGNKKKRERENSCNVSAELKKEGNIIPMIYRILWCAPLACLPQGIGTRMRRPVFFKLPYVANREAMQDMRTGGAVLGFWKYLILLLIIFVV